MSKSKWAYQVTLPLDTLRELDDKLNDLMVFGTSIITSSATLQQALRRGTWKQKEEPHV